MQSSRVKMEQYKVSNNYVIFLDSLKLL
jgi:hypothetical protein